MYRWYAPRFQIFLVDEYESTDPEILETVAEFTERPLLSLTCSDIGTVAMDVETNLKKWMKKARRWGAILLIDEADVYLEERNTQGFERNSLVSGIYNSPVLEI